MCDYPILAEDDGSGKLKLYGTFDAFQNLYNKYKRIKTFYLLPCGKCFTCRMKQAREWSLRCQDELRFHAEASFITLTYDDAHLPSDGSLCRRDYQLFLKRLRKAISPCKIRYLGCGEYGRLNLRPHYHFIIFGWAPHDERFFKVGSSVVFFSPFLSKLWENGYVSSGNVTGDSINYVCRYSLKKLDLDTSSKSVQPFVVASNHPGIGYRFFEKFSSDMVKKGKNGDILSVGRLAGDDSRFLTSVPRYYVRKLPEELQAQVSSFLRGKALLDTPSVDDLERDRRYSASRERSHNTRYGLSDRMVAIGEKLDESVGYRV